MSEPTTTEYRYARDLLQHAADYLIGRYYAWSYLDAVDILYDKIYEITDAINAQKVAVKP